MIFRQPFFELLTKQCYGTCINVHYLRSLYYWAVLTLGPIFTYIGDIIRFLLLLIIINQYMQKFNRYLDCRRQSKIASNMGGTSFEGLSLESIGQITRDYIRLIRFQVFWKSRKNRSLVLILIPKHYNDVEFAQGSSGWIVRRDEYALETNDSGLSWHIISLWKNYWNQIVMIDSQKFIARTRIYILEQKMHGRLLLRFPIVADVHYNVNSVSLR